VTSRGGADCAWGFGRVGEVGDGKVDSVARGNLHTAEPTLLLEMQGAMLSCMTLATWEVVHRWVGRVFFVAWVSIGVQLIRNDWERDGWYVLFFIIHGVYLVVVSLKDAAQRRAAEKRMQRIGLEPTSEQEAETSP
jgi:hypothetical protein